MYVRINSHFFIVCFYSPLFQRIFGFGYTETPKRPLSILKRKNRSKSLGSDSAETSFSYIGTKLVSANTLVRTVIG
jgi:hypothetical protein